MPSDAESPCQPPEERCVASVVQGYMMGQTLMDEALETVGNIFAVNFDQ